MLFFECDYNNGCHPKVLQRLVETNDDRSSGYGMDPYTDAACEKIRQICEAPEAQIYFLSGGTITNATAISAMLAPYEGVIAAQTGHVSVHECGAIEATGHKVLTLPSHDGKIDAAELREYLEVYYGDETHEHMVWPGMVYISWPTELGTIYSKKELQELKAICRQHDIPLYADGARLLYGLASRECDVTLKDLAELLDVFYIGGTKCGTLLGEALIFPRGNAPRRIFSMIKQRGALMAKGRLISMQFDALFTDGLYKEIGDHTIAEAEALKAALREKGYPFFLETPTNQQFVIAENSKLAALGQKVVYSFWQKYDEDHTVIRLCTCWATTDEDIEGLKAAL